MGKRKKKRKFETFHLLLPSSFTVFAEIAEERSVFY